MFAACGGLGECARGLRRRDGDGGLRHPVRRDQTSFYMTNSYIGSPCNEGVGKLRYAIPRFDAMATAVGLEKRGS